MQKSSSGQPGHEGRDFDWVPSPVAAPAEHIISPTPAKQQPEREKEPGDQRPAARDTNPDIIFAPDCQRADGKAIGDNKADKAQIEHRRVDDHARVTQERIQPLPIAGAKGLCSRWRKECGTGLSEAVHP